MIWLWSGFILFVIAMLALDLGVFHRKAHAVSLKESLAWSAVWIGMALAFAPLVYLLYSFNVLGIGLYDPATVAKNQLLYPQTGGAAMVMYLNGYITEKALSVDNIFVIALIFALFRIPGAYQHRVLFWGILGAIILRGVFIGVGAVLIAKFHWIIYVFGAILLVTAVKLLFGGEPDPQKSFLVKFIYRHFPVTDRIHGQKFYIRRSELEAGEEVEEHGEKHLPPEERQSIAPGLPQSKSNASWVLTPLGLALLVVEGTDVIFAVDSIPAIFGITADPFLVFTSNIFAILGLRALYFALAGVISKFHHLQKALALILLYIAVKMLSSGFINEVEWLHYAMPFVTLGVIVLGITGGIVASLMFPKGEEEGHGTTAF